MAQVIEHVPEGRVEMLIRRSVSCNFASSVQSALTVTSRLNQRLMNLTSKTGIASADRQSCEEQEGV